jgi:tetratricopeptide (TPR) repeat protein
LASISKDSEESKSLETWAHEYLTNNHVSTAPPDRQTYNTLFKVYADTGSYEQAKILLKHLLVVWNEQNDNADDNSLRASKVWYHCIFNAFVELGSVTDDLHHRIDRLLQEMKQFGKSKKADIEPDTITYNLILNVYAFTGNIDASITLLGEMECSGDSNSHLLAHYRPDCVSFTTVIKTFATCQQRLSSSQSLELLKYAEQATQIFERMRKRTQPNIVTCKWIEH